MKKKRKKRRRKKGRWIRIAERRKKKMKNEKCRKKKKKKENKQGEWEKKREDGEDDDDADDEGKPKERGKWEITRDENGRWLTSGKLLNRRNLFFLGQKRRFPNKQPLMIWSPNQKSHIKDFCLF